MFGCVDPSPLDRWMLDPGVVHLNHGSFGGCLRSVFEAAQAWRRKLEASPMRWFVLEWQAELDLARGALAAFLRAPEDRTTFVPSATTGVAIALASANLAPGDRILVTTHGYRAVANQLERLAAARGLEVYQIHIELPFDAQAFVDKLERAITPTTHLAVLDHVTSPTALRLPLERVLPMLADRRVAVVVDGAHAPGQLALDVGALLALGATWYTGNNHKWLCAPKGSGFLVAAPDAPIVPVVTSHGASPAYGPANRLHAELDWSGTHDPAAHLATPVAIEAVAAEGGGWPQIIARNHALVVAMRRRLLDALGATSIAPEDALGAMATIPVTLPEAPLVVERQLLTAGFEVPVVDWGAGAFVRVSAHLYNHEREADVVAAKLLALGVRGR